MTMQWFSISEKTHSSMWRKTRHC